MAGGVKATCEFNGDTMFQLNMSSSEGLVSDQVVELKSKLMDFFKSYMASENISVADEPNLMEEPSLAEEEAAHARGQKSTAPKKRKQRSAAA